MRWQEDKPSPEDIERREAEWEYNDLRNRKAEGINYYLSRGWVYAPNGMRLNNKSWNCDECQKNRYYPALKYRSAKDPETYKQGIYVCANCKGEHGYNNDPEDARGSLLYYHKEWEFGWKQIEDKNFIVPRLIRQIAEYPIYKDLQSLMWVRKRITNSTLGNPSNEELGLGKIIERLRVNYVTELNKEESVCVLGQLLTSNRIKAWQCYSPAQELVFDRGEQPLESIWDKYPFPVLNSAIMQISFTYYDCYTPYVKNIMSI